MDALELAMKMEKEGETFYRELAVQANTPGFRKIFNQLADDEVRHYQLFENMQQFPERFEETTLLKNTGNVFKQLITRNDLANPDNSQLILYQNAMELEKRSQEFFLEKAAETIDKNQRELFQNLAREEEKHYFLLHDIYELVLRPQTWVENGEFVHLEEY